MPEGAAKLTGIAKAIAENMEKSLAVPTATSTRDVPVKALEENRRILNEFLEADARPRCSFTHLIAYGIVQSVKAVSAMNQGYLEADGAPTRLRREDINLGLAVDLPGRDGTRTLVVPNIKACQDMDFAAFFAAYNGLIGKARAGKLGMDDFAGTTVSLTNPGGIGTVSSLPRLMQGQGTIVATGRIGYSAAYEATAPETLRALGVGKVMTLTSTYDHRVIQGAESGRFLAHLHALLVGEHGFYDGIFRSLGIPVHPLKLGQDAARVFGPRGDGMTETERAQRVSQLIHAIRVRGFLMANVDPLDLQPRDHPELNLDEYGLTIWDLDREFLTQGVLPEKYAPLREILNRLWTTYCRRMAVEYMYISDVEQKAWIQKRTERERDALSVIEKKQILKKLTEAESFERFLHKRYVGHKRFSVEGGESVIPLLTELLDGCARHGVTDALIGMAHRGRLNVLANVVGKSYEAIFSEFDDIDPKTIQGSGDVKYHLGARGFHQWRDPDGEHGSWDERGVRIELACNPSHLEAVNPVVLGQTRARQDLAGDRDRTRVVPVLIHGDAAFAAQGVVYETLQMSNLHGYRTGGCVHVIINNQIGYTTGPDRARTSLNASDVARAISAPVFRVNGDDPEACVRAARMALDYRMRFRRDVIIDMVCYRKYGHNEGDEPSFTQPILYRAIRQHPSVRETYAGLLVRRGELTDEDVDNVLHEVHGDLERAFDAIREKGSEAVPEAGPMVPGELDLDAVDEPDTAVAEDTLKRITERITYEPEIVQIHPRVKKTVLDRRRDMVLGEGGRLDYGMAEILAYGSLLLEGIPVRISGQDCGRGTFAHRHAIHYDVEDGRPYIPLNYLHRTLDEGEEQWRPSRFRIYDSLLSEEAVLGFEYGYSVTHPDSLVIWEAQFGDFFNGAQIQVDQFVASGEVKWGQKSRVCLLLPHGYDGQGPEHSSARIERFLQLCAQENMRVAICSTSAQAFHLLRRQAKQPKKPLVVFTHKSLLRADDAASPLSDFTRGSFQLVLDDPRAEEHDEIRRVVLCTGKVYWDLDRARRSADAPSFSKHTRIVRLEQLHPFPEEALRACLGDLPQGTDLVWCQEEPKNNGAHFFVAPHLERMGLAVRYVGRAEAASPATGSGKRHKEQQKALIEAALGHSDADPSSVEIPA
jgi:2-oxoglutarate dehydrogenase E1 component